MEKVLIRTVSTVEAVADMLEQDIYSLNYRMGEKIKEVELVERYGVSRNTLREAIAFSISKGLLEKVANKGVYVKRILASDIEEILHLRELLEAEALRRVIKHSTIPKKMHDLVEAGSSYFEAGDYTAELNADIEFHKTLVAAADSPRLVKLYDHQLAEVKLCIFQARAFVPPRQENIVLHKALLAAMEDKDLDLALALLSEHIDSAIETYKVGLARSSTANSAIQKQQ